jgi:hydrogenase maturation protease
LPGDERQNDDRSGDEAGELKAPAPGTAGVLVVGYGNPLRGDDGLGLRAVTLLAEDPRLGGVEITWRHQLTPELAADFKDAALVVLIDVNAVAPAGAVSVMRLDPTPSSAAASSHHVDPGELLGLARELWGAAPAVFVVSAGAATFELGDGLSPEVERALPEVVEAVVAIVVGHRGEGAAG